MSQREDMVDGARDRCNSSADSVCDFEVIGFMALRDACQSFGQDDTSTTYSYDRNIISTDLHTINRFFNHFNAAPISRFDNAGRYIDGATIAKISHTPCDSDISHRQRTSTEAESLLYNAIPYAVWTNG